MTKLQNLLRKVALIAVTSIILTACSGGGGGGGGVSSSSIAEIINSAPFFSVTSDSVSVAENITGVFYTVSATDEDADDNISYSLASGVADNDLFNISNTSGIEAANDTDTEGTTSGELSFKSVPDYETGGSYEVQVTASDGELSADDDFVLTVTIADVNEAPVFTTSTDTANAPENSTEVFYTALATDEDASDSISYSLAEGVADNDLFNINAASGELSFRNAPNYESDGPYEAQISASDGSLSANTNLALTVTITDVNEAPAFSTNPDTAIVPENSADVFYTASATDEDANDIVSYSLADGVADNNLFNINSASGELSFKNAPDYEVNSLYEIQISANDGNLSADSDLTLSVIIADVNEPPSFTTNTDVASAPENSTDVFYTASAIDEDIGDSLSYSLASGIVDNDSFNIDTASGELSFKSGADYENDGLFEVHISVSDGFLSAEENLTLTVDITNVNEAPPVFSTNPDTALVPENSTDVFYTALATDADTSDSISYSLPSGVADNDFLDIDLVSGELSFKSGPDYEIRDSYEAHISASDGNLSSENNLLLTIIITNVNEAPAFATNPDAALAPENSAGTFYTASVTDEDSNNSFSYSLASGVADNDLFNIDVASGELSFKSAPDFEANGGPYEAQISANDGSLSVGADLILTVTITDVNEAPVFTTNSATVMAPENSTEAFYVASATDEDTNDSISYSLASALADNDLFNINATSGELSFKSAPDYESDGPYEVQVSASDSNDLSAEAGLAITVIVTDVNEAPIFTISSDSVSTPENSIDVFYTASATDIDAGDSLSYSLANGVADNDLFNISISGELSFKSAPDYETRDSYEVQISASDGNLSSENNLILSVTITNVNEAAPVFAINPDAASAPENSTDIFYTASATDEDTDDSISYFLTGGIADNDLFNIDTVSGDLSFKSAPDYEGAGSYEVQISASDGNLSSDSDLVLTVAITDVNEAPVFSINPDTTSAPENSTEAFYTASATDQDASDIISYSLASGVADNDLFNIDSASGDLSFKSGPDYETNSSYQLQISASDDGSLSAEADLVLTVTITDVNEAPTANISITYNPADTAIATVTEVILDGSTSSDPDSGDSLSYTWSQSSEQSQSIFLSSTDNASTVFTASEAGTYFFTLTVSDGELTDSAESEVTIYPTTLPDDFTATAGDSRVTLTWTPYSDNTIYNIYRSTDSVCDLDNYNTTCSGGAFLSNVASGLIDTDPDNGTTYYYWIETILDVNTQRATNPISARPSQILATETGALNDTGIDWSGEYTYGNNSDCSPDISPVQDCHQGRDATHDDDTDGHAGFSLTKIDSEGNYLDANATEWSCVLDNVTGLLWEVKTDDGGLHDKDDRYSWYNTDSSSNGGFAGYAEAGDEDERNLCYGYNSAESDTLCNTEAFVNRVNTAGLCGFSDWRLPRREELRSIVDYSRSRPPSAFSYSSGPSIDTDYFPNTITYGYWSSTASVTIKTYAHGIYFTHGFDYATDSEYTANVRLVRDNQ